MVTMEVCVAMSEDLILLFVLYLWFRAIPDEIKVFGCSVLTNPGVISLCDRLLHVIDVG